MEIRVHAVGGVPVVVLSVAANAPSGMPSASSISSTVSQPSMNVISLGSRGPQVGFVDDQKCRTVRLVHDESGCPGVIGVFGDEAAPSLLTMMPVSRIEGGRPAR